MLFGILIARHFAIDHDQRALFARPLPEITSCPPDVLRDTIAPYLSPPNRHRNLCDARAWSLSLCPPGNLRPEGVLL